MISIGILESRSIARGIMAADQMLKAAGTRLLVARTVCSGRYLIIVEGSAAQVSTSLEAGLRVCDEKLHAQAILTGLDPQVAKTLLRSRDHRSEITFSAIGIVETKDLTSGIVAADICCKRAEILLHRLVLGQGINGKAYVLFTGETAAVGAALEATEERLSVSILEIQLIPAADRMLFEHLLG